MKYKLSIFFIFFFVLVLSNCISKISSNYKKEENSNNTLTLNLPNITVIDAKFPLSLTNIDLNVKNSANVSDKINTEIKNTIKQYYFNECSGDSLETYFSVKDTYINTIRAYDSLYTVYWVLLKHMPEEQVNSKVLFYDNTSNEFIDNVFNFNIHALYDYNNNKLNSSNLKEHFKINTPEIKTIDYNKDGKPDFEFTRLYHNGTANAIETTILKINDGIVDTVKFEQKQLK